MVRNSGNEIMQFSYGRDGLVPILMEGNNVPVDFSRILLHLKTLMPFRDELPLIGSQIVEILLILVLKMTLNLEIIPANLSLFLDKVFTI